MGHPEDSFSSASRPAATTTAAWTTTSTATTATVSTSSAAITSAITATARPGSAIAIAASGILAVAVKVGFVAFRELFPAFDGHDAAFADRLATTFGRHFRALLFQNGLTRETNPVAFHGQDFHEDLIAFLQFVADVLDAVLGDFADVQQAIGSGDDLDEGAEIGEARD